MGNGVESFWESLRRDCPSNFEEFGMDREKQGSFLMTRALGKLKNIFPYSFPFSTLWLVKAPTNLEFGCRMDIGSFGSLTHK